MVATVVSKQKFFCVKQLSKPYYIMNSKMAAPGNLKGKIGDNQSLFCPTQKYYFHVFQQNLKLDRIFNNLTLIYFKSGGFL